MAKLNFNYGTMSSSKSAILLMKAHSFETENIPFLCMKSSIDTRDGEGIIKSRTGMSHDCMVIEPDDKVYDTIVNYCSNIKNNGYETPKWLLVDEAQFLTAEQVDDLARVVDELNIDVECYGLRTDFKTRLFEGSRRLFEIADNINEIKSICHCGNEASVNARMIGDVLIVSGEQVMVGGNDMYRPLCRKCYNEYKCKL